MNWYETLMVFWIVQWLELARYSMRFFDYENTQRRKVALERNHQ